MKYIATLSGFQYNICTCGARQYVNAVYRQSYFNTTFVHVELKKKGQANYYKLYFNTTFVHVELKKKGQANYYKLYFNTTFVHVERYFLAD